MAPKHNSDRLSVGSHSLREACSAARPLRKLAARTLALLLTLAPTSALATSGVFDQFTRFVSPEQRHFYDGMPDETVDVFSGTLRIVHTDLVLPGKAGLDLRIVRAYSSRLWGRTDQNNLSGLFAEYERSLLGYGWTFHMGRLRNPNASGQQLGPCAGDYPVLELPDGSAQVFYRVSASNASSYISKDYWRLEANCVHVGGPGKGSCAWSPQGIRYDFPSTYETSFTVGSAPEVLVWPVGKVVDPHGNYITFSNATDHSGAIDWIEDTYSRRVSFDYVKGADGARVTWMTVGLNKYEYVYKPVVTIGGGSLSPRRFLSQVIPPAGAPWKYTYWETATVAKNQYALNSITYPHGGTVTYEYVSQQFWPGLDPTVPFAVVSKKTVKDRGATTGNAWLYAYSTPSATTGGYNTTTITRPGGLLKDVYSIYGFGNSGGGNIWRVGLTKSVKRAVTSTVNEVEDLEWDSRSGFPVSDSPYPAPAYAICYSGGSNPVPADSKVYAPALTKRTLTRDTTAYTTTYSDFDAFGQPQKIVEVGQATRTVNLTYDYHATDATGAMLNLVRGRPLTRETLVDTEKVQDSWTYDGPGFARDTEMRSGVTTTFGYHPDGNLARVTNALGHDLTLTDYANGVPRHVDFNGAISYTRTVSFEGWIESQRDSRNNTTRWDYDGIGRLKQLTPPGGNEATTYTYTDATSTVAAKVDAKRGGSYTVTTTFDGFGREVATQDSLGVKTSKRYDAFGRLWFKSYPFDSATTEVGEKLEFDGIDRVKILSKGCKGATTPTTACTSTAADLSTVTNTYSAGNCVTTAELRKPDTLTTTRCYASFGDPGERRLAKVTDAKGNDWNYGYTAVGNLKSISAPSGPGIPSGSRTFGYDSHQYLVFEKSPELGTIAGDPDAASIRYTRNDLGQPKTRRNADGVVWTYAYGDPLSRLKGITYGSSSPDDVDRTYESGSNNLASLSSSQGGSFSFPTYDELDRLRTQRWTVSSKTYTTGYDYDAAGCLTTITYPTGLVVTQTCDLANRVKTVRVSGTGIPSATIISDVQYHPSGQPKTISFGNTKSTTHTYDERARVKTATTAGVVDLAYAYDGVDNVVSYENKLVSTSKRYSCANSSGTRVDCGASGATTGYDPLNRLEVIYAPAASMWGTATHMYDALGNRTQRSDNTGTVDFKYDATTGRLDQAKGPITLKTGTFSWDFAGRLSGSPDGATYAYDGDGRRIRKTENGFVTLYHHDAGGKVIAETQSDGTRLRDYVYFGGKLVAVTGCVTKAPPACDELHWYHTDHLGSVVARTGQSPGSPNATLDYKPWGEPWANGTTGVTGDRQYNGRVYDSATGLHDYGARMYWPAIGRFISVDTHAGEVEYPVSLNRYAYVQNSPYKYTDPDGRNPLLITAGITSLAGALIWGIADYRATGKLHAGAFVKGAGVGAMVGVGAYGLVAGAEALVAAGGAGAALANSPAGRQAVANLTQKQQSAINKIGNILTRNFKTGPKGDIAGAVSDMVGNPIAKPGGGTWDHVQDLDNILRGLRNNAALLENVTHPDAVAAHQRATQAITTIEEGIKAAGL